MNLPAASCRVSKDFLPVTARSVATRQSHCKRLLRFARNDPISLCANTTQSIKKEKPYDQSPWHNRTETIIYR
jgi:hypothetical protein